MAPKGTASDRKLSQAECDKKLAGLFGGAGAIIGSVRDPISLASHDLRKKRAAKQGLPYPESRGNRAPDHGPAPYTNPRTGKRVGGIIHIFGDSRGNTKGLPLFTPAGGKVSALMWVGGGQGRRVRYKTGLAITFVHTRGKLNSSLTNAAGSINIGTIGGPRGESYGYIHTHAVFYSNFRKRQRVDPREVFCGW